MSWTDDYELPPDTRLVGVLQLSLDFGQRTVYQITILRNVGGVNAYFTCFDARDATEMQSALNQRADIMWRLTA